jgi:hypothetical protein
VRFAGQHILIDYLKFHPEARSEVIRGLTKDTVLKQLQDLDDSNDEAKVTQGLEVVVNSELFDKDFELNQLPALQQIVQFSLAGLLYYLGLVLQHLCNKNQLAAPLKDVRICMGGRGSLIFRSVGDQRELYREYFSKVSGLEIGNLDFHMSGLPKHEVSFGMLVPRGGASRLVINKTYDHCVLGEAIQIGENTKDGLDVLATDDLDKEWQVSSLPRFAEFLEAYASTFRRSVLMTERVRADLINKVEREIQDLKSVLQNDLQQHVNRMGSAEPVFIFPLRRFVRTMMQAGE